MSIFFISFCSSFPLHFLHQENAILIASKKLNIVHNNTTKIMKPFSVPLFFLAIIVPFVFLFITELLNLNKNLAPTSYLNVTVHYILINSLFIELLDLSKCLILAPWDTKPYNSYICSSFITMFSPN